MNEPPKLQLSFIAEPRIGLPITQQTLEKAIKLGRSQAKDIDEKEAKLIAESNSIRFFNRLYR